MDYGTLQGIITIVIMVIFVGIFVWAFSSRRKQEFDDTAKSIFSEEEKQKMNNTQEKEQND